MIDFLEMDITVDEKLIDMILSSLGIEDDNEKSASKEIFDQVHTHRRFRFIKIY